MVRKRRIPTYIIETAAGIVVLLLINHVWVSDNFGYVGVSPNPYWLVVIFIALRYGDLAGLLAGVLSAGVFLLSTCYNIFSAGDSVWYHIPYQQWKLAVLFVIFGFLAGRERSRVQSIITDLKRRNNLLKVEFEKLAMEEMGLKKVKNELEGRILGQADTVNTVYEVARYLTNLNVDELYAAVGPLVRKVLGAESCVLYIWERDGFYLKNAESGVRRPEKLDTDTDMMSLILDTRKVITFRDMMEMPDKTWKEERDPPMAAPLFFGESKETVSGVVLVEDIPFIRMNPDSVNLLSLLADWLSRSIDNALVGSSISPEDIYDADSGLVKYDFAIKRIREEIITSRMAGRPMSLIMIKVERQGRKAIECLKGILRTGDMLSLARDRQVLMGIFPGAGREDAEGIRDRIRSVLARRSLDTGLRTGIAVKSPEGTGIDEKELVKKAEEDLYG